MAYGLVDMPRRLHSVCTRSALSLTRLLCPGQIYRTKVESIIGATRGRRPATQDQCPTEPSYGCIASLFPTCI